MNWYPLIFANLAITAFNLFTSMVIMMFTINHFFPPIIFDHPAVWIAFWATLNVTIWFGVWATVRKQGQDA